MEVREGAGLQSLLAWVVYFTSITDLKSVKSRRAAENKSYKWSSQTAAGFLSDDHQERNLKKFYRTGCFLCQLWADWVRRTTSAHLMFESKFTLKQTESWCSTDGRHCVDLDAAVLQVWCCGLQADLRSVLLSVPEHRWSSAWLRSPPASLRGPASTPPPPPSACEHANVVILCPVISCYMPNICQHWILNVSVTQNCVQKFPKSH